MVNTVTTTTTSATTTTTTLMSTDAATTTTTMASAANVTPIQDKQDLVPMNAMDPEVWYYACLIVQFLIDTKLHRV
jgi:hypothetical protein